MNKLEKILCEAAPVIGAVSGLIAGHFFANYFIEQTGTGEYARYIIDLCGAGFGYTAGKMFVPKYKGLLNFTEDIKDS